MNAGQIITIAAAVAIAAGALLLAVFPVEDGPEVERVVPRPGDDDQWARWRQERAGGGRPPRDERWHPYPTPKTRGEIEAKAGWLTEVDTRERPASEAPEAAA